MASDELSQRISMLYRQVEDLRARSLSDPGSAAEILNGAMGELQVCLEELSAAKVKLCQQNEELLLAITERKQIERELKESEEWHKILFERANDGIVLHDVTVEGLPGCIIQANEMICRMLGYTMEELIRLNPMEIQVEGSKMAGEELQKILLGETDVLFERNLITKEGRVIPVEFHTSVIDFRGNPTGLSIIRDITERKRSEETLKANEEHERNQSTRLQAVLDAAPAIIWIAHDSECRNISGNRAAYEFSRVSEGTDLSKTGSETELLTHFCIFKDGIELAPEEMPMQRVAASGHEIKNCSLDFHFDDGTVRSVMGNVTPVLNSEGKPNGAVAAFMDITEIKRAEEELRQNEQRFRLALKNAPVSIAAQDCDLRFVWAYNQRTAQPEKVVGKTDNDLFIPEDAVRLISLKRKVIETGVEVREQLWLTRNKKPMFLEVYLEPIRNAAGDVIGIGIATVDLTERKQLELELMRSRDEQELRVAERTADLSYAKEALECINEKLRIEIKERRRTQEALLEAKESAEAAAQAKSDFMANMSHEIRTPMNAVIGMTSLLLDDNTLNPEHRDFIETIRMSGDALMVIINDILDFSKMQENKVILEDQPFDLGNCIEEALDLVAGRANEKSLNLAYTIDRSVPDIIVGDPNRLRQILSNLLNNAVKFTDRGEIKLSVSAQKLNGSHEIRFAVQDTGIGISNDQMDRLFQPFSQIGTTVKRNCEGTGLGLSISKRLAELMGGKIWAESEPGKGSTFYFTIKAESAPGDEKEPLAINQPLLVGKHVLIVNDNRTNRRILGAYIYSWGMVPLIAPTSQDALDWIRRGDNFDVAILDTDMHDMDGQTLANEIHKCNKALSLLMLTSTGGHPPSDNAYLTKPIKPSELHRILTDICSMQTAKKSGQSKAVHRGIQTSSLRILLAEDNVSGQKVAKQMLKRLGYRADVVANGIEALQALERQPYDVVLMDLRMPEMDGLEATRIIRQRWPDNGPKIIAVTAYALQGDKEKCIMAGMDDYISKPIRMNELAGTLSKYQPADTTGS